MLAALFAPVLAVALGWQNVFGIACIPLVLVLVVYSRFAKDAPGHFKQKHLADYAKMLGSRDAWLFMFFYSLTFGGFSGFASALPGYFHDQFGFDPEDCRLGDRRLRLRWFGDAPAGWLLATASAAPRRC